MNESLVREAVDRVRAAHQRMISAENAYWQAQHALNDAETERFRARGEENEAAHALKAAIVDGIADTRMEHYLHLWTEMKPRQPEPSPAVLGVPPEVST